MSIVWHQKYNLMNIHCKLLILSSINMFSHLQKPSWVVARKGKIKQKKVFRTRRLHCSPVGCLSWRASYSYVKRPPARHFIHPPPPPRRVPTTYRDVYGPRLAAYVLLSATRLYIATCTFLCTPSR